MITQRQQTRLLLSVGTAVLTILIAFLLTFFGAHRVGAEYACGTYGAGDYTSTSYQDASCDTVTTPTTITPDTATPSAATTNSGTSSSSSSSSTILPVEAPTPVNQTSTVNLETYPRYTNGDGQHFLSKKGQQFTFLVNGTQYTATLKDVTSDQITVTITGTTDDIIIPRSATAETDVNKDGVKDISFGYAGLQGEQAEVIIHKVIPAAVETTGATAEASGAKSSPFTFLFWLIPLLLVVIAFIIVLLRRRRSQNNQ